MNTAPYTFPMTTRICRLKILVADVVEHLAVTDAVRSNASIAYCDAGHMMYVHPPSMQKFKNDRATFVDANAR